MSGQRTEAATPRRLAHLRDEGQVARSADLVSAAGLLVGLLLIQGTGASAVAQLQGLFTASFADLSAPGGLDVRRDATLPLAEQAVGGALQVGILALTPLLVVLPLMGIGMNALQGATFSPKLLVHGWSRLNPVAGFRRLFAIRALVDLLRSSAKLVVVLAVVIGALRDLLDRAPEWVGSSDPRVLGGVLASSSLGVGVAGAEALFALAVLDYAYQRWTFTRNARMTKQEIKDEHKQQEGDPFVKAAIRARQRRMARTRRQLEAVPSATVVLTNPTHLAVAVLYERSFRSPKVVAKGADLVAERIKRIARDAGVPVMEHKPLARSLFQSVEVGEEIPVELYQAVAEVLAYAIRLGRRLR